MEFPILEQTNRIIRMTETILGGIEDAELSFEAVKAIHTFKQLSRALNTVQDHEDSDYRIYQISRSIANSASQAVNMVRREIPISENKSHQINALEKLCDRLRTTLKNTKIKYSIYKEDQSEVENHNLEEQKLNQASEKFYSKNNPEVLHSLKNSIESLYSEVVEEVEKKRNEVNELLGQLTEGTLAKSYEDEAKKERQSADSLRTFSLMVMGLMVILAIIFWAAHQENSSWPDAMYRLVTILTLSIPATYLAKESSRHRDNQKSHLQTALDIKSITPFISSLPPEQQHEIRGKIAEQIFSPNSNNENNFQDISNKTIYHSLIDLAKQVKGQNN